MLLRSLVVPSEADSGKNKPMLMASDNMCSCYEAKPPLARC